MKTKYNQLVALGSLVATVGYVTSGPLGFLLVKLIKPQPAWTSASVFAENYSVVQDVPYYFGFLLIGGMLMIVAGHYLQHSISFDGNKFYLLLALCCTIVFCTSISFNYICQNTFVRHMAVHYKPEYDAAIAMFSMSNPMSFCWANEMWGYGFLGLATWLMSISYKRKNRVIQKLLISNGVVSMGAVVANIVDVSWLMTLTGLICYFVWNMLMIVLMFMIYRYSKMDNAFSVIDTLTAHYEKRSN